MPRRWKRKQANRQIVMRNRMMVTMPESIPSRGIVPKGMTTRKRIGTGRTAATEDNADQLK